MEGLARKGSWRRALALADDMDQVGLPPDARTLSILLQLDGYS
jgi:pentatricopeptide repeat protein